MAVGAAPPRWANKTAPRSGSNQGRSGPFRMMPTVFLGSPPNHFTSLRTVRGGFFPSTAGKQAFSYGAFPVATARGPYLCPASPRNIRSVFTHPFASHPFVYLVVPTVARALESGRGTRSCKHAPMKLNHHPSYPQGFPRLFPHIARVMLSPSVLSIQLNNRPHPPPPSGYGNMSGANFCSQNHKCFNRKAAP